jgi:ribosome-binding protein aMBF1 (putative translation factor)
VPGGITIKIKKIHSVSVRSNIENFLGVKLCDRDKKTGSPEYGEPITLGQKAVLSINT